MRAWGGIGSLAGPDNTAQEGPAVVVASLLLCRVSGSAMKPGTAVPQKRKRPGTAALEGEDVEEEVAASKALGDRTEETALAGALA